MGVGIGIDSHLLNAVRYIINNDRFTLGIVDIIEVGLKCLDLLVAEERLQLRLSVDIVASR